MRSEELYKYLTGICKKKNMPIEGLPRLFGFSRSSLYRYMTGISRMSPEVRAKFIHVLRLDDTERRKFDQLVGLSAFDSAMIAARHAFDQFVFGQGEGLAKPKIFDFAYHAGDTLLRTSEDIYALIEALVRRPQASCVIRVINCLGKDAAGSVLSFIERLLAATERASIEHLVAFPEKAYEQNINTLIALLPLLKYQCYSVYYSPKLKAIDFYEDKLIIDVNFSGEPPQYFFLSFHNQGLSHCLATLDKSVFDFWSSNYQYFKESHGILSLDCTNFDIYSNRLLELQQNGDHYLLKPDFCYDDIPISVYHSMVARTSAQELAAIENTFRLASDEDGGLQVLLASVEQRRAATYTHRRINLHSMDGLRQLAMTGRLSDHFTFIPPFNTEELRTIFTQARDRDNDSDDNYTLLITRKKILVDGHIFFVFENNGMVVEYDQDKYQQGLASSLFIKNQTLAVILSDYVRNHIPDNYALSREETTAFLNSLIASLD